MRTYLGVLTPLATFTPALGHSAESSLRLGCRFCQGVTLSPSPVPKPFGLSKTPGYPQVVHLDRRARERESLFLATFTSSYFLVLTSLEEEEPSLFPFH